MSPGISSYAYTWAVGVPGHEPAVPMQAMDLVDKAVDLGVNHLQIADNLPLENFSEADLTALQKYARRHQIALEVGAKKLTSNRLRRYIQISVILKSDTLRFIIDGSDYTPSVSEIIGIIKEQLPDLENHHIQLAIENHDRLLSTEFVDIIERIDSAWVGICLDTVNSMGAGEGLETVIARLAPLAVNFHVKEFTVKRLYHMMGFAIEGLPLGTGMLPVTDTLMHLGPRCKTAILEQWLPPEQDIQATIRKEDQWAKESIRYLKSVLT